GDDAVDRLDGQMNGKRRPCPGESLQCLARRHGRGAARRPGQHHRLGHFRQGQFLAQCGSRGRERWHAGRDGVRNAELVEPAQLLAERAPHRKIARVQPRYVVLLLRRAPAFLDDLVERHGGAIYNARTGRAVFEQLPRHERPGVEANRALADQLPAAHGYEVGGAGAGADEMYRHRPSPVAIAQTARASAMRSPSRRALRPATTSADASAIDGNPLASSTCFDAVTTRSATPASSLAAQATSGTASRRAASGG